MIKIIVAYDHNRGIGFKNKLPWRFEKDLEHFYRIISGKILIVGLNTFESLNLAKFVDDNQFWVLSDKKVNLSQRKNVIYFKNFKVLLKRAKASKKEICIIGGASIYRLFLPYVDELIITKIDDSFLVDCYFPKWNQEKFQLKKIEILDRNLKVFYYLRKN